MSDSNPPEGNDQATEDSLTGGLIQPIEIQEEMERSFLDYAMTVITARALPDARDGLKPVHRRILYGMYDMGARPDRPHLKSARVVGDVMGKYHPHGSSAIYDALVRLAQDFSLRNPLIDGHGNFGSPDDPAAAERYCLVARSLVRMADGATVRIGDIVPGADPHTDNFVDLKVLDHNGEPVRATTLFHSGHHPTLRLLTKEGYELTGTHNHPVLCLESLAGVPMFQWKRLDELSEGMKVVVSRHHHEIAEPNDADRQLGILLGGWVSEGWAGERTVGFANTDYEFFDAVRTAFDALVCVARSERTEITVNGKILYRLELRRRGALADTPLDHLTGLKSVDKRIPSAVWSGSPGLKRAFLQAMFEGDGSMGLDPRHSLRIYYSSRSERLVAELQLLLLEFGIASTRRLAPTGEHRLAINGRRNCRLFALRVGFFGTKQRLLEERLAAIPESSSALSRGDSIPYVAKYLRAETKRGGREWINGHNVDRIERWERDGDLIRHMVHNDEAVAVVEPIVQPGYFYATVSSIEEAGVQPVYSLKVDSEAHSFLAGGFVNHNTEARLDPLAMQMLAEIDEDTVDFNDNYSGEYQEPSVLPARFPNLLVNGSEGIAVGMATRIPPHNLGEIVDAVVHLVDNPDATPDDLMQFVKGPDFPTGGFILGRQGILDAYRTGRGSIRMRAKAEIDENKKGTFILVTEIPYQTSVGDIAVRIDELVRARELDGVADVNDESAKGKTKLVIKLKRDANANVVLNNLYKHTQLQTSYGVNMVALVDGVPRTLNLRDAIVAYVDHQIDVIRRRSEFRLKKAQDRLHIVEGLLKALDMIDLIVEKIRASADRPEARDGLMAAPFEFTEIQANYILDMTLSRLTRLGRSEYEDERAKLLEEIAELESILGDDVKLRQVIKDELGAIRAKFATPRRAEITYDPGDIGIEDLIDDEPLVVTMTKAGYIKTVAAGSFKVQGRGGRGIQGAKLKEEDLVTQIIHTTAHAYLLFFSNSGRVYRLRAHEVPMKERTAKGTAIVNLLPLQPGETIQAIIDTRDFEGERYLFFATRQGQVKKTLFSEYDKSRREGFIAINLKDGDELRRVITTSGSDDIFMVSRNGQTIRFSESEMRPTGRAAQGVIGMRLKADDEVVSCDVARDDVAILMITDAGFGKRTQLDKFPRKGRGTMGVKGIKLTARRGYVVAAFMVGLDDEIVLVSSGGVMNRQAVRDISSQGRDATGVRVMNLDAGQSVASAAPILASDDTE